VQRKGNKQRKFWKKDGKKERGGGSGVQKGGGRNLSLE